MVPSSFPSFEQLTSNLTWAALPAAFLLAAWPHWYTIYLAETNKVQGGWANTNPRAWVAQLNAKAATGKRLSALERTILRGQSCQANSFENVPTFVAATIFANYTKLDNSTINKFIITYLGSRFVFTLLYLKTDSYAKSFLRTAVFQVGILAMWYVWIAGSFKLLK
ncbi:hypothetical protein BCV70DRAFT_163258 [Testicularia cyperi]|uniref:Membrane-associated proteins in eicosanoid and glutathione metabolism n=1 Tax=Testicularia cyperi TaxID=1882483 RepID=A0A317XM73_9BASI|nr:hypothetical protein BCV70DRAFT_163258 [Testicularia cyperi]